MRGSNQGERRGNRSAQQGYADSPAAGRGRGGAGGRSRGTAAGVSASPAAGTGRGGSYNAVPPPAAVMGSGSSGSRASGSRDAGSGHRSGLGYSDSGRGYHGSAGYDANDGHNTSAADSLGGGSAGAFSSRGYSGGPYSSSPSGPYSSSYGGTGRGSSYGTRAHDAQGSSYGSSPSGRGGRRALPHEQGGGAYPPQGKPHFCIAEGDWGVLSVRADPKTQSIFEVGSLAGQPASSAA